MPLKIIGAGFGRTGTLTLKAALEQLGFGPCHHMIEVFSHPEQRPIWYQAALGEAIDWEDLLGAYQSSVDWPSCHFYQQLSALYPGAKVILTLRDPQKWWQSMNATILKVFAERAANAAQTQDNRFVDLMVAKQTFDNDFSETNVIAAFERHNARVRAVIPANRLLVYEVTQGWAPLCDFLDVPMPPCLFPRTNSQEEFWAHNTNPPKE